MPRMRTIKPGFFTNEELAQVSPLGRLLFAGLWTIADREGRLEDRPQRIKAELLPYDKGRVDELLGTLAERGFIIRYEVDGRRYIQVTNFDKHQSPNVKEAEGTIPAPYEHGENTVPPPSGHQPSTSSRAPVSRNGLLEQEQVLEQEQEGEARAETARPLRAVGGTDAVGRLIDAVRDRDPGLVVYGDKARLGGFLKRNPEADVDLIADAYASFKHGEWPGSNWLKQSGALWAAAEDVGGYVAWRAQQGDGPFADECLCSELRERLTRHPGAYSYCGVHGDVRELA